MQSSPLILNQLHKKYGANHAVRGVSFELKKGEVFGLLGPNGAGKTSIISCLVTLEEPTSGEILMFGEKVGASEATKFKVGIVGQEVVNHGFFSVQEILEFQSGFYGLNRNQTRIDFLLKALQLIDHKHKKVKQLSGGMKRRLMIAKALVHNPPLLLLDEPTAGVDIELRAHLWNFIRELQKEGTTILLTTHYLEEAEELCHRVGVINKGELIALEETAKLISRLTQRELKVKLVGQDSYKSYSFPREMKLHQWLEENHLNTKDIEDLMIEDGRLEVAVRSLLQSQRRA